jgi:UDP-N-acetylglucosamine--N-acetylmuramyl-(pentapeptide) pyrophosphoryl-undecaprenol N-acetylglucosamine transferase
LSAQSVATLLETLTRTACLTMAKAARGVGKRDSNDAIAGVLEQLAKVKP